MIQVRELPRSHVPAIVNGIGYTLDPIGYIRLFARHSGPVSSPRFPGFGLIVSVSDPVLIREVFTGDPVSYRAGESSKPVLEPTVGSNSLLMERKMLRGIKERAERLAAANGQMTDSATARAG